MSASTVSITANPAARRRPVVVGEKKSGIELVTGDGVAAAASGGGEDDKFSGGGGNSKDLSQSIRGDAVFQRSREMVQVKKALPNSTTALPRRTTRKGVSKPEKTRWQTVMSVFTKNFLLLLVLLGLVQMIRRLALNSTTPTVPSYAGVSEFEGRIAEVEAFLKTTTKMMQVQVEVVDRKIENEVGSLRREMGKKIEDKGAELAIDLKKLDGRTESLEKQIGELRATEWLSKEDFDRFLNEFKKGKASSHGDVNLDEIRAFAREIVEKEIEKHAADGLGRVDYALASGGAIVTEHSEPYNVGKGSSWFYTSSRNRVHKDAGKMLRPSFGEPGQCFPLKGSTGFVQIKLRTAIIPEAITLEHVAKSVAYDRSSAPKDCRISGWLQGHDPEVDTNRMFLLTEFTYDLEKSNAQTFDVLDSAGSGSVNMIRLDFTSNHGSPSHTCIYRLRVHGHEINSVPMLPMQS
ncbi:SUN domain-containing protein 1-like [Cornus florida]|uniref:SUN domain-containing protein 1-like n=1 Tax=Cornus florida TaxID=4283 RepID=UPI0028995C4E|nr:SUN domain-containing protein 1-like [Cornus florida]